MRVWVYFSLYLCTGNVAKLNYFISMKNYLKMAAIAAALCATASCEHIELSEDLAETEQGEIVKTKAFTFHVKGAFETCYDEMGTRAGVRLEENNTAGVTDLWVMDYVDGVLVQQVHQSPNDASFGTVKMSLTYGHHDIKFVASKGEGVSLSSSAISWAKVKDTFTLDYPVDVVASSNGNRAPELKRAISGLRVVIADAIPTDAKTITLTLGSRSQSLTLPALSALPYSESSVELDCTSNRGVSGASASIYTLAGDEEWQSTASISVKREDGTVITAFDLPEVTLKKNRMTALTGEVFNRTSGFSVAVDTSWEEDYSVNF